MIIISQDKKSIYNFNNVKSIDRLENEIYITDDILSDEGACIGIYDTEERAQKVLNDIANEYLKYATLQNGLGDIRGVQVIPRAFIMPEE